MRDWKIEREKAKKGQIERLRLREREREKKAKGRKERIINGSKKKEVAKYS